MYHRKPLVQFLIAHIKHVEEILDKGEIGVFIRFPSCRGLPQGFIIIRLVVVGSAPQRTHIYRHQSHFCIATAVRASGTFCRFRPGTGGCRGSPKSHRGSKKLIDVRIAPCIQIGKLQLLHCFRRFRLQAWDGNGHDGFRQRQFPKSHCRPSCTARRTHSQQSSSSFRAAAKCRSAENQYAHSQVDLIQRITVPGDLRLVVVQRGTVLIDNGGDTLVAGHNALDGVGAFDGLHLCDSFQLRKNLRVFVLSHACHRFERRNIGSEGSQGLQAANRYSKRSNRIFSYSTSLSAHNYILCAENKPLFKLSAY